MALLQGPQLLAASHSHDDPPAGLLLVFDLLNFSTSKRRCGILDGLFLFHPGLISLLWPLESSSTSFIHPGSSPEWMPSLRYCCFMISPPTELEYSSSGEEQRPRNDSLQPISLPNEIHKLKRAKVCLLTHLGPVHILDAL